jgi:pimeloyl-ACP methyl ester carboxylesterase
MLPLANKLRRAGFYPINWGYRSVWGDVAGHARGLERKLLELELDPSIATIHVVAHSMGSIVARQAILNHHPSKLGRVVMLCPPNGGSHVATRLAPVLGLICKTLVEITDLPDSWVNRLPTTLPSRTPVGVIVAGGDLVVAPESTHLPGVEQRLVIPGMHSGVLLKVATAEATIRFLRTASF